MQHIKWPSIEQFKNVVRNVSHNSQYKGKDENGNPIMDRFAKNPTLKFEGTEKLHGTSAAFVYSFEEDIYYCQSRERIITPTDDNAGFAMFVHDNMEAFMKIVDAFINDNHTLASNSTHVMIAGERCGGNIQKGIALNELPKMFVIFGVIFINGDNRIYIPGDDINRVMKSIEIGFDFDHSLRIFNIWEFPTYNIEIDFENPHKFQNIMNEWMLKIEEESPVGKMFGVSGIGEGIVFRCVEEEYRNNSGYWFKVKGSKHSKSKVKTLANVDVERIEGIKNLAEILANNERLEQFHQIVFNTLNGGETDVKGVGAFIKAVMNDIAKEELDVIAENGYSMKDISSPVSRICKDFIMQKIDEEL